MEKIEQDFVLEKETKNTYRYACEGFGGKPPAITTIYIAKWALSKTPPNKIKVIVEEA